MIHGRASLPCPQPAVKVKLGQEHFPACSRALNLPQTPKTEELRAPGTFLLQLRDLVPQEGLQESSPVTGAL